MNTIPAILAICEQISQATGKSFKPHTNQGTGGGCINKTFILADDHQKFFIKSNRADLSEMFVAEVEGLNALNAAQAFRIPEVICHGSDSNNAWLVLEYLPLGGPGARNFALAGEKLALQHQSSQRLFGWHRDNTIGSSPQVNNPEKNWSTFWKQHRLGYQLKLASSHGYHGEVITVCEDLIERCDAFFDHDPKAALLHGDLWSGNLSFDDKGQPVIYDPAVYYGDAEADIAMTELFGGFGNDFYQAYNQVSPIDSGYRSRKRLYNLYHILNHMNLFGGGYQQQSIQMARQLLSELK